MQKQVRRRHDAHVRAQGLCAGHSALFDATAGGQKTRTALGTHVAEIDRLLALQERLVEHRPLAGVMFTGPGAGTLFPIALGSGALALFCSIHAGRPGGYGNRRRVGEVTVAGNGAYGAVRHRSDTSPTPVRHQSDSGHGMRHDNRTRRTHRDG